MDMHDIENVVSGDLQDLSFFDVKEVYDRAYDVKNTDEVIFHTLLAEAVKMDLAYRRQLRAKSHKSSQLQDREYARTRIRRIPITVSPFKNPQGSHEKKSYNTGRTSTYITSRYLPNAYFNNMYRTGLCAK